MQAGDDYQTRVQDEIGQFQFLVWYWWLPSWSGGWRLGYRLIDHLAEISSMGRGIWARRVGDKEARNDPASHRATGGMVKVSSNRRTRRSHRPAPKKINHERLSARFSRLPLWLFFIFGRWIFADCGAPSALRNRRLALSFIHLRRATIFNPPVTIFLIRMKS